MSANGRRKVREEGNGCCEDHGILLLHAEDVKPRENHVIECAGHMITRDTRNTVLLETTEYLPKTHRLTEAEVDAIPWAN
jgi:hypothetical protein